MILSEISPDEICSAVGNGTRIGWNVSPLPIVALAKNLPDESYFGESNADSIEWSLEVSRQLYAAAGGHDDEVTDTEVKRWLDGEVSDLSDYE